MGGIAMNYHQLLPELFVGSSPLTKEDVRKLAVQGVTAVLNLTTDDDLNWYKINVTKMMEHFHMVNIEYHRLPVEDFNVTELSAKLPECIAAVDQILRSGHRLYLHCIAGVNRSPTVAIAYLHRHRGYELTKAILYVMSRRPCDPLLEALHNCKFE